MEGGTPDEAEIRDLVEKMIAKPDPVDGSPMTASRVWNSIVRYGLLYRDAGIGWVIREGKMLSADWGAHEKLLHWLGIETKDAENMGWALVEPHGYQCKFRLSKAQKRRIEETGKLVDSGEERLKRPWRPMAPDGRITPGETRGE